MDHSDASDISIEVFSNHFCPTFAVCLRFIRCGSWLSGVRSTLSVSPASRPPRCCGFNFPSSNATVVNFHIEYVDNSADLYPQMYLKIHFRM